MKILYYSCFSGISGDMNLGAMVDLGIDEEYVKDQLSKLNLNEFQLDIKRDMRKGISGTNLNVLFKEHHHHRHLEDIEKIIMDSSLNNNIKNISTKIFRQVAMAEAKVHNCEINEVHFHEVGAMDSIVDIVGSAICFDYIKVDKIICSTVELGSGFVKCAHGILPVPAPATVELIKNMPTTMGNVPFEATTPTGAAILKAMVNEFSDKNNFKILKVGYGIGNKDLGNIPNILRVFLCEDNTEIRDVDTQEESIIECNIDDMNPEIYEYVSDKLFEAGASDVYFTPIIMKKGRPAIKLSVLCNIEKEGIISEIIFTETTSLGIRKYEVKKEMLRREFQNVETKYGDISIKYGVLKGERMKYKAEYDQCKKIANVNKVPLKDVYQEVYKELNKNNG